EGLTLAAPVEGTLADRHAGHRGHLAICLEQDAQLLVERDAEGILGDRSRVLPARRRGVIELYVVTAGARAGAGNVCRFPRDTLGRPGGHSSMRGRTGTRITGRPWLPSAAGPREWPGSQRTGPGLRR